MNTRILKIWNSWKINWIRSTSCRFNIHLKTSWRFSFDTVLQWPIGNQNFTNLFLAVSIQYYLLSKIWIIVAPIFLLMICQKKTVFNGPFYDIYRYLLAADILYFWTVNFFCYIREAFWLTASSSFLKKWSYLEW